MTQRTRLTFNQAGDPWSQIDAWAQKNGCRLKESNGSRRLYQKGVGFLVAPMMFQFEGTQGTLTVEAWIRMNLFVRAMAFFILPGEMGVESGGFRAALPRSMARKVLNELLSKLGQPTLP